MAKLGTKLVRQQKFLLQDKNHLQLHLLQVNVELHRVGMLIDNEWQSQTKVHWLENPVTQAGSSEGTRNVTLKGHPDFLLSYFQVLNIFIFTAVVIITIIIIPILSTERQPTDLRGFQKPRNTQTPLCPDSHRDTRAEPSLTNDKMMAVQDAHRPGSRSQPG